MQNVRLNSYVYVACIVHERVYSISKVKVIMKNKEMFIHEYAFDDCMIEEFRQPLYFKDYGKTWFKTLKEAQKVYGKLKKVQEGYYELIK